jgi:DNA-binding beta-propeller fold protein YncE
MQMRQGMKRLLAGVTAVVLLSGVAVASEGAIRIDLAGTYATGVFDEGAAEIPAFDPASKRLFVVNGFTDAIDVIDIADPARPSLLTSIAVGALGSPNSVAVAGGIVAVAIEDGVVTNPGRVAFFDTAGNRLKVVRVGALPDMLTFTPDGRRVLVANEGEADEGVDPVGSVSIIDLSAGVANATVQTLGFIRFNRERSTLKAAGVRFVDPNATVAQDLEPEYIAVAADGRRAWVTLQENNALALIDLVRPRITGIVPLGAKDHRAAASGLDASDEDGGIFIRRWPVFGLYMPDSIAAYRTGGGTYLITANEGDSRGEDVEVQDLALDPVAFPDAAFLQEERNLGVLEVSAIDGDPDGDGRYNRLFAYGARSFSIWSATGDLVWDSGDRLEQITARRYPADFNATNDENGSFDDRSPAKGPEPEGVAVGSVSGRTYAFVGLERIGGIVVFDVTDPTRPRFIAYTNNRDFAGDPAAGTAGDLGPEGLLFIPAAAAPTGVPLLVVANEVSGTTSIYTISDR